MVISAFVGHSFLEKDKAIVNAILESLNAVKLACPDFSWDHARAAEPKDLREKVLDKIEGKNLFIGICTAKEAVVSPENISKGFIFKNRFFIKKNDMEMKTSDWIVQEIGLAIGKNMKILLLIEKNLREPGGLQGNVEYIPFDRNQPNEILPRLIEMITSLRSKVVVLVDFLRHLEVG